MQRRRVFIAIMIAAALLSASLSFSQEKKEPTSHDVVLPDSTQAPLPKISLPEFVITGNETIDLPSSTKNADDANMVYVAKPLSPESVRKSAVTDLGQKEDKNFSASAMQMNGKILAGFGAYTTPFIEGWFGKNYETGGMLFHAQYLTTDGHVANANHQKAGIDVSGDYNLPSSFGTIGGDQLNGGVSFLGRTYRAYGSTVPTQVRSANDVRINVGLSGKTGADNLFTEGMAYSGNIFGRGYSVHDSSTAGETEVGLSGTASTQYNDYQLSGSVDYISSTMSSALVTTVTPHSPQWFVLRFTGRTMLSPSLQVTARIQQFLYRGNFSSGSGRLYPQAELRYFLDDQTTLFAGVNPTVERTTLRSLFGVNPYITNAVLIEPNDIRFAVNGGAEVQLSDRLRGVASLSYKFIRYYTSFLEDNETRTWTTFYVPKVHLTTLDVRAAYRISDQNSLTASATVTSGIGTDSSVALPYLPVFRAGGVYRHNFNFGIAVEGYAEYISKQWNDFSHTHANAGYVSVGGRAEYDLHHDVRVFMQLSNLLDQRYYVWDGYLERTFYISLGLTYTW